ncbi:MAG: hypothetical protein R3E87_20465 [Burkholderiaceae bacterium]
MSALMPATVRSRPLTESEVGTLVVVVDVVEVLVDALADVSVIAVFDELVDDVSFAPDATTPEPALDDVVVAAGAPVCGTCATTTGWAVAAD